MTSSSSPNKQPVITLADVPMPVLNSRAVNYDKKAILGIGGSARVALTSYQGQPVVVKVYEFYGDAALRKVMQAKMLFEYNAMKLLEAPGSYIVKGFSYSLDPLCLLMEYMEKGPLKEVLAKENLNFPVRMKVALQVAKGLKQLHDNSIVHVDLSSFNVLLDKNYDAKLIDFADSLPEDAKDTSVGTMQYMSRERISAQQPKTIKRTSDIYSYGMLLLEILNPTFFKNLNPELMLTHEYRTRPDPSIVVGQFLSTLKLPLDLPELILDCIAEDPAKRPLAKDIVKRLEAILVKHPELNSSFKASGGGFFKAVDGKKSEEALDSSKTVSNTVKSVKRPLGG